MFLLTCFTVLTTFQWTSQNIHVHNSTSMSNAIFFLSLFLIKIPELHIIMVFILLGYNGNKTHRAEFSDTSWTFSITCSAKFEIARVKRRETIKKMAENGATSTAPYLFSFYTAHWSIRYTRAFKEEVSSFYSKHFSKLLILYKAYQTDVENALVLFVTCMKYWLH